MLVTLYIFGTPLLIELNSISYEALDSGIMINHSEHVATMPAFFEHRLCLSYKETEAAALKNIVNIAPNSKAEDFPKLESHWSEVSILLVTAVSVYKAGKDMVAKNSNLLFSTNYFSNVAIGSFTKRCNNILNSLMEWRTMETDCCDINSLKFSAENFMNPPQNHKEYFVIQEQSSYSRTCIAQLLTKVSFPEAVMDRIKQHGMKRKYNEKSKYLDAFADTLSRETPLQTAVKRVRTELRPADWKARVDACVDNLTLLNKHVECASIHSDSARRLMITEVVKQVVAYTGGSFYVEAVQNLAKHTDASFLGWGPLDYIISPDVILAVLGDETEDFSVFGPIVGRILLITV